MSDKALLSHLVRELRRTTRAHLMACGIDVAHAHHAVDKAEKRIFSLFDKLTKELEAERRALSQNLAAFDALLKERDRPTTPQHVPFDEAKARAGEPVQVQFDGKWHDAKYIGFDARHGSHVVNCQDVPGSTCKLSYWSDDAMRMKQTTQQVQMFANVYGRAGASGQIGALYQTKDDANRMTSVSQRASAFPVTITVTL